VTPVPVACQCHGDNYFNVAEQVLAIQRDFAKSVLAATTSAATSATSAAPSTAKKPTAKKAKSTLDRSNQRPPAELGLVSVTRCACRVAAGGM
jgi:hypothetical protein